MCKIMEEMREASWLEGNIEGKIEGKKEGIIEGKKEGIIEGKKEGIIEGVNEEKRSTALRMLASGSLPLESIAEFSGLPLDEVKKLSEGRTA